MTMTKGEMIMIARITKVLVLLTILVATFSVGGSDSLQIISGEYKLVEVNGEKIPAVSWIGPGEGCKQEVLSGTMLVDSKNRWAALVEEREFCTEISEEASTRTEGSSVFTGTYKVSGSKIEFHDEALGLTDYASIDGDVLRYTVIGIGDYEGNTSVFVFLRVN